MSDSIPDRGHSTQIPPAQQSPLSIPACVPSATPAQDDLTQRRRALSTTYLQDATGGHLSPMGQAQAAFDAGYLAILVVLGESVPTGYEHHPDPVLIQAAAAKLNLPDGASDQALFFISRQYDLDYRQCHVADALLAWARLVRSAAGIE